MLKSILGIAVGFLTPAVLVTLTDQLMMSVAPGLFPDVMAGADPTPVGMAVNLAYGTVYAVIGGWLMAVIVQRDVMRHLKWLLGLLVVFGAVSLVMSQGILPTWYSVLLVVLGAAGYYAGVTLYLRGRSEIATE